MSDTSKKMSNQYLAFGVCAVLIGAVSFVGGTAYQKGRDKTVPAPNPVAVGAQRGTSGAQGTQGGPPGGFGGRRGGGGLTVGEVTSVSGGTISIQSITGNDQTVDVTSSTTVSKTVDGSVSDIAVGDTVTVSGSAGSDGSLQAASVQIRPSGSGGAPYAANTQGSL